MGTQFKLEISNKSVLITIIDNVSEDFADDYRNKLDEGLRKSKITVINNNSQPNKTASSIDCRGKYQLYNYAKQMKKRSRTVKSLIYLNFRPGNCKFITLTFNAKACDWDCTDLNACHAAFRRFIKRINAKYKDFQYVAVFARQKIGNWHYHMIANFDDTVREKTIRDLWQYGRTDSVGIFHNSDFEEELSYCVKNMEDTGWEELQWYLSVRHFSVLSWRNSVCFLKVSQK
jgi:hypothetical protein